ncbi:hypothetical protein B0H34DRAFT_793893 [Crassisporium funariophilum]|nr:hypothetical protein B0H34DRAFT_793893 [Crassisporium funariophilum]
MKIEWESSFRPDGTRCKPPPSRMHGWLAKLRGTLSGNEELRSKGMKEMRDAISYRKRSAAKSKQHQSGRGLMSLFSFSMGTRKKQAPVRQLTKTRGGSQSTTRPTYYASNSNRPVRPPLRASGNSHRSGGASRQASSRPQNSYSSQRRSNRR